MKLALLSGTAVASLLALSDGASAEGAYVGAMIGGNWLGHVSYDEPNAVGPNINLGFQSGLATGAAVGFTLMPGFRLEGEIAGRFNNITTTTAEGTISGSAHIFAVMANGWYDFAPIGHLQPYVGGGVGVAGIKAHVTNTENGNIDATKAAFAYQLGAGVGYALGNGLVLSLDYRFLGTSSVFFPNSDDNGDTGLSGPFYNHSLMVGARFDLGSLMAPPPAP